MGCALPYLLAPDVAGTLPPLPRASILGATESARLRERAGDWPPVFETWREVLGAPVRRVLLDLSEGDPLSAHQAVLAALRPKALVEALSAALLALQAEEAVIAVPGRKPELPAGFQRALASSALRETRVRFLTVQGDAVSSLESSLAALALGLPPVPTALPSGGAPLGVAVHRPDTLLQLHRLLTVGPEDFRRKETFLAAIGQGDGPLNLHEVPIGTTLRTLFRLGGVETGGEDLLLLGSALSSPLPCDPDLPLDPDALRERGLRLGGGGMRILRGGDPVPLLGHVDRLAASSCGQCPSCVLGAKALRERLHRGDTEGARKIARFVRGKGLCPLLDALCDAAQRAAELGTSGSS